MLLKIFQRLFKENVSTNVTSTLLCLRRRGALSDAAQRLDQLDAQRLDQATRAVRTADPSAHGRRSAAIGRVGTCRP